MRIRALLTTAVVVLGGCSVEQPEPAPDTHPQTTTTATLAAPPTQPIDPATTTTSTLDPPEDPAASGPRRDSFLRRCATRVATGYGRAVESEILRIGPIAFPAMDFEWTAALSDFYHTPDEAGRYPAIKVVAVVAGDAIGPVSVSIVEDDRDSAGLVYDSSRWTSMTLDSTDHTVRFEVCSGIDAQFNGGFVITKPTCLRLVVVDEGPYAAREWRSAIPFGVAPDTCV